MKTRHATGRFRCEQLEQRRLLCGLFDEGDDSLLDQGPGAIRAANDVYAETPGLVRPAVAGAQVPFHGSLAGTFTSTPVPGTANALVVAMGTGQATQLGHFTFNFPLTVNLATQTGGGTYTLTAANGDTIVADVVAQSSVLPNGLRHVVETATITGGTGRFTNATGSFTSERFLDRATGRVTGSFDGTISSPGAGNRSSQ